MRKSVCPKTSSQGSRVPTQAKTCPTARRYCSTCPFLTGFPFCESYLVRARCAKKMEKRYGIMDVCEVGLDPKVWAVLFPLGPIGTVQFYITGRDSGFHCFPDSTVVSA